MPTGRDSERDMARERSILIAIADLIGRRQALAMWPPECQRALRMALIDPGVSAGETWKVTALWRHLFGPSGPAGPGESGRVDAWLAREAIEDAVPAEHMIAERLRADLPGMVRLRRGVGLFGGEDAP